MGSEGWAASGVWGQQAHEAAATLPPCLLAVSLSCLRVGLLQRPPAVPGVQLKRSGG